MGDVHGNMQVHRSTVVSNEVGVLVRSHVAMIDERQEEEVISIAPMNMMDACEVKAYTQAIADFRVERVSVEAKVKVLT